MSKLTSLDLEQVLADPAGAVLVAAESLARNLGAEWWFYAQLAAALAVGVIVDVARNRDLKKRYRSENFRVDAVYGVLDLLHIPHFAVIAPLGLVIADFLKTHASWMTIDALAVLPAWAQILLLFVFTDLWVYGWHRLQHTNPVFWQFHKTHHSQVQLNVLTGFRVSILDRIANLLVLSIPAAVMSVSYAMPLAIAALLQFHQLIIHSATGWTFVTLERVFVSPSFHEVHHSIAPEHRNRNYGGVLTVWDHVFGSYAPRNAGELTWGLVGETVPESYVRQMFVPIVGLYGLGCDWLRRHRERKA